MSKKTFDLSDLPANFTVTEVSLVNDDSGDITVIETREEWRENAREYIN